MDDCNHGSKTLALNLDQKKEVVAEVSAEVAGAQVIVIAENKGLEVGDVTRLRAQARAQGVYLRVLKNTLARRAVSGTPFEGLANEMTGPLMYGMSADPVAAAKVVHDFAKGNDKLVIRGGALANYVMDAEGVKALASMPSREQAARHPSGHDAGADRQVRADAQRSAGQVCPHRCRAARRTRKAVRIRVLCITLQIKHKTIRAYPCVALESGV